MVFLSDYKTIDVMLLDLSSLFTNVFDFFMLYHKLNAYFDLQIKLQIKSILFYISEFVSKKIYIGDR